MTRGEGLKRWARRATAIRDPGSPAGSARGRRNLPELEFRRPAPAASLRGPRFPRGQGAQRPPAPAPCSAPPDAASRGAQDAGAAPPTQSPAGAQSAQRGAPPEPGPSAHLDFRRSVRARGAHRVGRREHTVPAGCTLTPRGQTGVRTDAGPHPDLESRLGSARLAWVPRMTPWPRAPGRSADGRTEGRLPGAGPGGSASGSSLPRPQPRPPARAPPPPDGRRSSHGRSPPRLPARGLRWALLSTVCLACALPGRAPGREARVRELRVRPEKHRWGCVGGGGTLM